MTDDEKLQAEMNVRLKNIERFLAQTTTSEIEKLRVDNGRLQALESEFRNLQTSCNLLEEENQMLRKENEELRASGHEDYEK